MGSPRRSTVRSAARRGTPAFDSSSVHHQLHRLAVVPALEDRPIPIGAIVTVWYDDREVDGELLGIALGRDAAYVRIPISESRHRIIVLPWTAIRRRDP